jgi:dipeptidyl aminopeptidase/acylaminoacyl peptidase
MRFSGTLVFRCCSVLALLCLSSGLSNAREAKKPFTVTDEIGLVSFGHPNSERTEAVQFSPDGNYLLVVTERGRLDLNRIENSLRFYRSENVREFLQRPAAGTPLTPVWITNLLADKETESDWRWLTDSINVVLLQRSPTGRRQLLLVDLKNKSVAPLTSPTDDVEYFDVAGPTRYVYTRIDPTLEKLREERGQAATVGTGRSLWELIFPENPRLREEIAQTRRSLWAVMDSKPFEIRHDDAPVVTVGELALSPDGRFLVTKMTVAKIPQSWPSLFHVDSGSGSSVHQYVLINLQTGAIRDLTDAPISDDARAIEPQGEWALTPAAPSWSSDGKAVVLPGTFVKTAQDVSPHACVAVFDLSLNVIKCVETLKRRRSDGNGHEAGFHYVVNVRFLGGDKRRVIVSYDKTLYGETGYTEYRYASDGTWQVDAEGKDDPPAAHDDLRVSIRQGLEEPPVLMAEDSSGSRILWDPNPQLKNLDLGHAEVYTWTDKKGRQWNAGLYKPSNYKAGVRYPLVVQTHGFVESQFLPSGLYPTAFAARELAAAGVVVVQVAEHSMERGLSPEDAPTAVANYRTIINQLVIEGLVDPEKIGVIGFSHTCWYVMQALTNSELHVAAASITEGEMGGYFQYLQQPEREMKGLYDAEIGAVPVGSGLQRWLKQSPGFNLDKVNAPLLVVGNDPLSLLLMWESYAGLRVLNKPVDLIMLYAYEHVLTNPAVRLASQGGSVDWFRFWLQGYEDPDPSKAAQYHRWEGLCDMQVAQNRNQPTFCVRSKAD